MSEPLTDDAERQLAAEILGGEAVLHRSLKGPLDVHEMILEGLPGRGLKALIENLVSLDRTTSLEKAVGISLRTFQRVKEAPERPLSPEQSGRTWKFAEILARATTVFGSREEAEHWLERPATGLNQQRPIDLLAAPAGVRLVEDFLSRVEYGVYV
jgi:putative toxin-antitoxin system antitoxin component (TIGR02293 family)